MNKKIITIVCIVLELITIIIILVFNNQEPKTEVNKVSIESQTSFNDGDLVNIQAAEVDFKYKPTPALNFRPGIDGKFAINGKSGDVLVNDFRNNESVIMFDSQSGSYILGTNNTEFEIIFSGFDQNFQIIAKELPAAKSLQLAQKYLVTLLDLSSTRDICDLKTSASIDPSISNTGFGFQTILPDC